MQNRIVIFDLDGTIYQNSVFHRGYLRTLVAGTWAEPLEADLVRLAEAIFAGRELDMNRFYRRGRAEAATVPELVQALRKRVRAVYRRLGLPVRTTYNKEKVLAEMLHDKKAQGGQITVIKVPGLGCWRAETIPVEGLRPLLGMED